MPETSQTRLQLLQARIRLLGLDKLDAADRQVLEEYLAAADAAKPGDAAAPPVDGGVAPAPDPDAQLAADIVRLVAAREEAAAAQVEAARLKADAAQPPTKPAMGLVAALQTPPFYFFFGLALLGVAFVATQTNLNSSLTFLVAILGVAIVLYGTGSQAAGTFGSATEQAQAMLAQQGGQAAQQPQPDPAGQAGAQGAGAGTAQPALDKPAEEKPAPRPSLFGSAGANVAIAGGAAVMAAFFGWGVIEKSAAIRQVFRDFDQYVQVRVLFCDLSAAECRTQKGEKGQATADPVINDYVRSAIVNGAYIETPDGRRAYARPYGNGLEFVLFDRELGNKGEVRLMAQAMDGDGRVFTARNDYFDPHKAADCLGRDPSNPQCALWTDSNGKDPERVQLVILHAAIIGQGNVQANTNSNLDLPVARIEPN